MRMFDRKHILMWRNVSCSLASTLGAASNAWLDKSWRELRLLAAFPVIKWV